MAGTIDNMMLGRHPAESRLAAALLASLLLHAGVMTVSAPMRTRGAAADVPPLEVQLPVPTREPARQAAMLPAADADSPARTVVRSASEVRETIKPRTAGNARAAPMPRPHASAVLAPAAPPDAQPPLHEEAQSIRSMPAADHLHPGVSDLRVAAAEPAAAVSATAADSAPPPAASAPAPAASAPAPAASAPAPAASAPAPASAAPPVLKEAMASAPAPELLEGYARRISDALGRYKEYPRAAQMRGWQGSVTMRLHVASTGRLIDAQLYSSSGHDVLDKEALALARKTERLPAPPDGLGDGDIVVLVPIVFRLESP